MMRGAVCFVGERYADGYVKSGYKHALIWYLRNVLIISGRLSGCLVREARDAGTRGYGFGMAELVRLLADRRPDEISGGSLERALAGACE